MSDNLKHSIPARRGRQSGLCQCRAYSLTPEGAAVLSTLTLPTDVGAVSPDAYPGTVAPSGHSSCPPSLRWLCEGPLPFGWVKAGGGA